MIKGEKITLRTVKETDLAAYYALLADIQNRGDYYPQRVQSYTDFQSGYHNRSFWRESRGALLIVDDQDSILGEMTFRELPHRHALDNGGVRPHPVPCNQGRFDPPSRPPPHVGPRDPPRSESPLSILASPERLIGVHSRSTTNRREP
jgi:hypothetical protein